MHCEGDGQGGGRCATMNVEKIRIVKNGKRYKRVVIPDGYERCAEFEAEMVTWAKRVFWSRNPWWLIGPGRLAATERPIYIRRKAQP